MNGRGADEGVRARLRAALPAAMKARDKATVTAVRSALAALDEAEAVDADAVGLRAVADARIAGTVGGLGAGEVARATLDEHGARTVVEREIAERRAAAEQYDGHGQADEATRLRVEADALASLLTPG